MYTQACGGGGGGGGGAAAVVVAVAAAVAVARRASRTGTRWPGRARPATQDAMACTLVSAPSNP